MKVQSSSGFKALVSQSLRLIRRDVPAMVILVAMPLLVVAFMGSAFKGTLVAEGFSQATGAEQSVAGVAVLFSFLLVPQIGYFLFREHEWKTWERIRISGVTTLEYYVAKSIVPFGLFAIQFAFIFGYGALVYSLPIGQRLPELIFIGFSYAVCLIPLAFFLFSISRSVSEFSAFANLTAILFAGLGGAFSTQSGIEPWMQAVGKFTPGYWAMTGYRSVLLGDYDAARVLYSCIALLLFGALFLIAAIRIELRSSSNEKWS